MCSVPSCTKLCQNQGLCTLFRLCTLFSFHDVHAEHEIQEFLTCQIPSPTSVVHKGKGDFLVFLSSMRKTKAPVFAMIGLISHGCYKITLGPQGGPRVDPNCQRFGPFNKNLFVTPLSHQQHVMRMCVIYQVHTILTQRTDAQTLGEGIYTQVSHFLQRHSKVSGRTEGERQTTPQWFSPGVIFASHSYPHEISTDI